MSDYLKAYLEKEKNDTNAWWKLSSGEHQVLFHEAIEVIDTLRKQNEELTKRVKELEERLQIERKIKEMDGPF